MEDSPSRPRSPARRSQDIVHYTKSGDSFLADIPHNLKCTICHSVLSNPHQCRGGHLYCYECIRHWLKKSERCPKCSCPLSKDTLGRNLIVAEIINELEIKCNNSAENWEVGAKSFTVAQDGCAWVGSLGEFDHHCRKDCAHVQVSCNNVEKGCISEVLWKSMANHLQVCAFEEVACDLCFEHMLRGNLAPHKADVCPNLRIGCPNGCGEVFLRRNQADHLDSCEDATTTCPFSEFGCPSTALRRREFAAHQAECVEEHLRLVQAKVLGLATSNADLKSDICVLKGSVSDLKAQISSLKSSYGVPLVWRARLPEPHDDLAESRSIELRVPSCGADTYCNVWLSMGYNKGNLYLNLNICPSREEILCPIGVGGSTLSCGGRTILTVPLDAVVASTGSQKGSFRVRISPDMRNSAVNGEIGITALLFLKDSSIFEL